MYTENLPDYRPRKALRKMEPEPDCAMCQAPASMHCSCERRCLDTWIDQVENRTMQGAYEEVRAWVKEHAKVYILSSFRVLKEQRMLSYRESLTQITNNAFQHYGLPPHPQDLQNINAKLKRDIDEDWQSSVHRYPEVIEYYFSLIRIELPNDAEAKVRDPPLGITARPHKPTPRLNAPPAMAGNAAGAGDPGMAFAPSTRGRTPPPPPGSERMTEKNMERMERERRRTPGPPQGHYQGMPRRHPSTRRHHQPPPAPYYY